MCPECNTGSKARPDSAFGLRFQYSTPKSWPGQNKKPAHRPLWITNPSIVSLSVCLPDSQSTHLSACLHVCLSFSINQSLNLLKCLSIYLSNYQSTVSIYLSALYPSFCQSLSPSIAVCLSFCLSIDPSIYQSIHLSAFLPDSLLTHPSACLTACLSCLSTCVFVGRLDWRCGVHHPGPTAFPILFFYSMWDWFFSTKQLEIYHFKWA
jgi:hypothetical protein